MALVHSYIRYSTKKQDFGDSFRRQTEEGLAWIARNNHTLSTLKLHDKGIPSFRGQNRETGKLGQFLSEIGKRVQPGDYLLLEHLDRLSRQGVSAAMPLFQDILKAGVNIVCLRPSETIYTEKSLDDLLGMMMPLVCFHLAHLESLNKSVRLLSARSEKRKDGGILDDFHPAWVDLDKHARKFSLNDGVKAIEYIYQRTAEGIGQTRLVAELQAKFPAIGRSGRWTTSYISKVLTDRAVLGERQNHTFAEGGVRKPIGDPTPNYYPAAITEELWDRAQGAKVGIAKRKGPSKDFVNLFTGLLHNTNDGSVMHMMTGLKDNKTLRRLVSYRHVQRVSGADPTSVDYYQFERIILEALWEIKPEDLECTVSVSDVRLKEQERAGVDVRLTEAKEALTNIDHTGSISVLMSAIGTLETRRDKLDEEIRNLKAVMQSDQPLANAKDILQILDKAEGEELQNLRHRLRGLIGELVESVWVKPEKHLGRVYWAAQICFKAGNIKLTYHIPHTPSEIAITPFYLLALNADLREVGMPTLFDPELLEEDNVIRIDKKPVTLKEYADLFLMVAKRTMKPASYRVVPSKIDRFVVFLGGDTLPGTITAKDWSMWIRQVQLWVGEKKLERSTARVTLNRSRELIKWLIGGGEVEPIEGLDKSAASLLP